MEARQRGVRRALIKKITAALSSRRPGKSGFYFSKILRPPKPVNFQTYFFFFFLFRPASFL
jgi:hypothetical protein